MVATKENMLKEHNQVLEQHLEEKKLQKLIERYKDSLGGFDLVHVDNAGYILQSQRHKPMSGGDWIFFDLDDTLVAYSLAKGYRLKQYAEYLLQMGIELSESQAEKVLKLTDSFSRWEEHGSAGNLYHANYHMLALQWATQQLRESNNPDVGNATIESELDRIKVGLHSASELKESDPFSIRTETKKLTLRGMQHMWSKKIEDIFMGTTINPPQYDATIRAGSTAGVQDSIHRTNIGVFTYGDPYFQLLKTFELLEKNRDLNLSQIWLSKIPKGVFVAETVNQEATRTLSQEYVPSELEEYPGEGMAYGSGYVLSRAKHTILMVDDDPSQLSSILESNILLTEKTGAQYVCIRSKQPGTKMEKREWQVSTAYGELDFTSTTFSPSDVQAVLLINLLISSRSRLGENHPNSIKLEKKLVELDFVEV